MNEITFSNYKFKFELNDPLLDIQIRNIINNNLFDVTLNVYTSEISSVKQIYQMILNALNQREYFNIQIHENLNSIKIILNYDTEFINVSESFTLKKINECLKLNKINECCLQDEINGLKKNIDMLISHNNQLEQKIVQLEQKSAK